jgi:hypothetical protein
MKGIAFFVLGAAIAVLLLSDGGAGAKSEKSGRGNRIATKRAEYGGERVLSKTLEAPPERVVTVGEELSSDTQPEERTLPSGGRVVGYVFFLIVAFAASAILAAGMAVGLEYLVGWPDTWWL